jgi:hypothetical protein
VYKEITLYLYTYLMADSIRAYGKILDGTQFEFNLDGISTAKQMERLISLTDKMAKAWGVNTDAETEQNKLKQENNKLTEEEIKKKKELGKYEEDVIDKMKGLSKVSDALRGDFKYVARDLGGFTSGLALGVGTIIGALTGYADQLQLGLQRGVSGGIMDFAIAAKTGGVSLGAFSKSLEESGGAFASLGDGATDGAKNFGALIGGVRTATASVGNLGLSNDQLANLTAQQVKVAVSQGFKGTAAQNVVINNTRALAKELDILANQTGKSVLEMTQAAVKLAQDPLVSSFVRDIKTGGANAAKALNSYAANFTALFGKEGDKLARDTIGPALSGLPMIVNDTGKNLALASQSTYNEIDRLAQKARKGEAMTDEDRQRLSNTIKKEVAQRGQELRYMSELGGPLGDSAKQFLALAQEVENYNSAAGEQRRKEDKAAQEFNTAINQFKANIQALAIPFLNLINGIDWTVFIEVISGVVKGLGFVLHILDPLGKALGMGPGGLVGVVLGLGAVMIMGVAGYKVLNKSVKETAEVFKLAGYKLKAMIDRLAPGTGPGIGGFPGGPGGYEPPGRAPMSTRGKIGLGAAGVAGLALPYAADYAKSSGHETLGSGLNVASSALTGAATGAMLGSIVPIIGTTAGAIGGAVIGALSSGFSEWSKSDNASGLAETDMAAVDQSNQYQQASLKQGHQLNAKIDTLNENMGYSNSIGARGVAVAETGNRQLANLQYGNA